MSGDEERAVASILPEKWEREVPGFPVNRSEEVHLVDPIDGLYHVTPEALSQLLTRAGYRPKEES